MKKLRIMLFGFFVIASLTYCIKHESNKPLLNIVSPTDNYAIFKGDTINIIVQASAPYGLLTSVDFLIDNNPVYQALNEPYKFVWHSDNAKGGQHKITIVATDNNGETNSKTINVIINTVSPKVATSAASFIGTTLCIAGGDLTAVGIPAVSQKGICWSKQGSPTINESKIAIGGDLGVYSFQIKGLELGTKYYYRAYTQNVDTIVYGDETSFTTKSTYFSDSGTFVDNRDATRYKWVKIGNQTWMAENLKYMSSDSPTYVPNYTDPNYLFGQWGPIKDFAAAKATVNYKIYGCLYRFANASKFCPDGWHLPSTDEWLELINYVGGEEVAGGILKEAGTTHWNTQNTGTNKSFFTILPAGLINTKYGMSFGGLHSLSKFWSSNGTEISVSSERNEVSMLSYGWYNYDTNFSVRCIKN